MDEKPLKDQLGKVKSGTPFRNKNFLLILFMILLGLLLLRLYSQDLSQDITRTEFLQWIENDSVKIVKIELQKTSDGIAITGERAMNAAEKAEQSETKFLVQTARRDPGNTVVFRTHMLDVDNAMISYWEAKKGVPVRVIHETTGWLEHLFAFLPILLIIVLFWVMMMR